MANYILRGVCIIGLAAAPVWAKDSEQALRLLKQGLTAYQHGDLESALDLLDKSIQEEGSAQAHAARAQVAHALGNEGMVRQDLKAALPMRANDPLSYTLRGTALVLDGSPERAVEDLNSALKKDGNYAAAYLARGRAYRAMGDLQKASADWAAALKVEPKMVMAFYDLADAEHRKGDDDKAIASLTSALRNNPKFPLGYSLLGVVFAQRGDNKRALAAYSKAVALQPQYAYAFLGRAAVRLQLGDKDAGMKDYDEAVRLAPQEYYPYYDRGEALWRLGEKDAAVDDFRKAAGLGIPNLQAAAQVAGRLKDRGKLDDALGLYSKTLEAVLASRDKKQNLLAHDLLLARARLYEARQDFARAQRDLDELLRLFPDSVLAWTERAKLHLRAGQLPKAQSALEHAVSLDPKFVPARVARGEIEAARGQGQEALKDFDAAIEQDAKSSEAYGNRGLLYAKTGDNDKALEDFTIAVSLAPDNAQWQFQLGVLRARRRDFLKALGALNKVLKLEPPSVRVIEQRAQVHEMLGDETAAIKDLRSAIDIEPKSGGLYVALAGVRLRAWDPDQALKDLGQVKGLKYDSFALRYNLGLAYGMKGQYSKAVREFKRAVDRDPRSAPGYTALCRALRLDRSYRAAEKACRHASELDSKYALAFVERGLTLLTMRDFEGAVADFNEGWHLGARYAAAELARSIAHIALHQYKEADAAYRSAMELDAHARDPQLAFHPKEAEGKGYHGWVHSFQKQLERDQDDLYARLAMGNALASGGYLDRAVSEFTKAMQTDGLLAAAYADRCAAYQLQNNLDLAEKDCRHWVELSPLDPQARARLLELLALKGTYVHGLEEAIQAIRAIPRSAAIFVRAGNLRYFLKDVPRAQENYRLALEADPNFADGHNGVGLCQFSRRMDPEAIESLSRAIALEPRNARYYRNRAAAYVSLKAFANAAADYRSALAVNNDPEAQSEYKRLLDLSLARSSASASNPPAQ